MSRQNEIIECACCFEEQCISIDSFTKCKAEPKHLICNRCYQEWGTEKCFFCDPFKDPSNNVNFSEMIGEMTITEFLEREFFGRSPTYQLANTQENLQRGEDYSELDRNIQIVIHNDERERIQSEIIRNHPYYRNQNTNRNAGARVTNQERFNTGECCYVVFLMFFIYSILYYIHNEAERNNQVHSAYNKTNTSLM